MISFTRGNLLQARTEALVNTVNTVGVMGKGIALMFKERFDLNYSRYAAACKEGQVSVGRMFVTETGELDGPRWIINFPTKEHWRRPSRLEWIEAGLLDMKRVLRELGVRSVAVPPLGAGNGGLIWSDVRALIERTLGDMEGLEIVVYEPTDKYLNVAKRSGVEKLTPARALVAEAVRRYSVLGMDCSLLEVQKLAWFLERSLVRLGLRNDLKLQFGPNRYGPFAPRLSHLLASLDGSYLHCDRRVADAGPLDVIWFEDAQRDVLRSFLKSEGKDVAAALELVDQVIEGFESPYGMELLSSVDWLIHAGNVSREIDAIMRGLSNWPVDGAGERKRALFDERSVGIALERLITGPLYTGSKTRPVSAA